MIRALMISRTSTCRILMAPAGPSPKARSMMRKDIGDMARRAGSIKRLKDSSRDDPTKPKGRQTVKATAVAAEMSERKQAQLEQHNKRNRARPLRPATKLTPTKNGPAELSYGDGENPEFFGAALYDLTGTASPAFMQRAIGLLSKIQAGSGGVAAPQDLNAGLAVVAAIQPENEAETLLALQMVAANEGALNCMAKMRSAQFVDQLNTYGNLANKFMRTFNSQMETLAKLRRGGEQIIKYVHVHEGGQAVIGSTINQGGKIDGRDERPHGQAADAPISALPGPDPARDGVSVSSDAEREMRQARWEVSRSSEGE